MTTFSEALESGRFVVTSELNPPKGTDLTDLKGKSVVLKGMVDAFNLTDSAGSHMTMGNIAAARALVEAGVEPILQVTCRDRNRLALQGELLAADALGIHNVLCMTGDPPGRGDHPDTKPVFDLDAVQLLAAIGSLNSGTDMSGNRLNGTPTLFPGAVANPGSPDLDLEVDRMEEKIDAGARFFQTQAVYEPELFERFMNKAQALGVPVLAGLILLKSARMARNLNDNLPGVTVPDALIDEMENASDRRGACVEITARIVNDVRDMCSGVHVMAIGWEDQIPAILKAADLAEVA